MVDRLAREQHSFTKTPNPPQHPLTGDAGHTYWALKGLRDLIASDAATVLEDRHSAALDGPKGFVLTAARVCAAAHTPPWTTWTSNSK